MAFRITPAHDPTVQIEFELPIKDAENLEFSVPKLHYFPPEISAKYKQWFTKQVEAKTATDRACTLKLLELLVPDHYKTLEKLTDGEIAEISRIWEEQSRVGLGESSPSSDS
ncbi:MULTISPECIES: hypothetical protein [unclassified Rhodococcus (in: high G+C Gram-positive bacteria)]|uniref:hypothetical protein n=1 Tax=unclassified Rhodococcus (in: high G+C Gram-positive bacteria) TaxID=192944 RepID=UPI00092CD24E|nr:MULTISPECIES: hypothetical protein [unclassified Rhodococcus (in: high G+C Gram-positive bacteria)]MCZ1070825.1 hypothetical protein [Rhodococcus sp. A5(2022)]OLL21252.1 hypothetical protein BKE56_015710 [Rhodococcus sp. M8]